MNIVRSAGIAVVGALACCGVALAQQPVPAVGHVIGGVTGAEAQSCTLISPSTAQAAQAFSWQHPVWLPLVGTEEAQACANVVPGADVLLDASNGYQELVMADGVYLTDLNTQVARPPVAPTFPDDFDLRGDGQPDVNQRLEGIWPFEMPDSSPVNWPEYINGERATRLEQRPIHLRRLWVDSNALFNNIPSKLGAKRLYELCPATVGQSWQVDWLTALPNFVEQTWLIFVAHPRSELPAVCPIMDRYEYMIVADAWKYLPASIRQEIEKEVEDTSAEYRRPMWVFPDAGSLLPTPAEVAFTITTVGAARIMYAQIVAGGGSIGGGGMMLFTDLAGDNERSQ